MPVRLRAMRVADSSCDLHPFSPTWSSLISPSASVTMETALSLVGPSDLPAFAVRVPSRQPRTLEHLRDEERWGWWGVTGL